MTVLACFGHWYVSLIYAAPALLLGGALGFSTLRDRRRRAAATRRTAATAQNASSPSLTT